MPAGWRCRAIAARPVRRVDQGYGLVCDVDGRPLDDLILVGANQEHGIVARRSGRLDDALHLPVGTQVRILPNHACSTAAQYDRYQVLGPDRARRDLAALQRLVTCGRPDDCDFRTGRARAGECRGRDRGGRKRLRGHGARPGAQLPGRARSHGLPGRGLRCEDRLRHRAADPGPEGGRLLAGNLARGLGNHQSSTLLFDPETGRASALVSANYLTGVRTGAASAIATKHLSRRDSNVLGIIGTGVQAHYQLQATLAVRPIRTVHAWDPSAENLASGSARRGWDWNTLRKPAARQWPRNSDILITVTPSQKALVEIGWVRPGTHINAMGADTKGKQELDPALVALPPCLWTNPSRRSLSANASMRSRRA